MGRSSDARAKGRWGARGCGAKETRRDGVGRGLGVQRGDVLDRCRTEQVDRQLGLGEQMADRTVAGLDVVRLEGTADTVAVPAVVEGRAMAPARHPVEARSAQHQGRVKCDQ